MLRARRVMLASAGAGIAGVAVYQHVSQPSPPLHQIRVRLAVPSLPSTASLKDGLSAGLRSIVDALSNVLQPAQLLSHSLGSSTDASSANRLAFARSDGGERSLEEEMNDALSKAFGMDPPDTSSRPPQRHPFPSGPSSGISASSKVVYWIAGTNVAVYLMWQVPALQGFMQRYFMTSASSLYNGWRGWITQLTCTYSHVGLLHLGLNMMGLISFSRHLMDGRSTTRAPKMTPSEFLAFYTGTGVFASVASNAFNLYARIGNPSVGASGAIFGVLSYFCMSHPDAGILVFFIPMSAFSGLMLGTAVNAGLVIRAASAFRNGRAPPAVDGMAHLAGTIAGIAYYYVKSAREQSQSRGIRI